MALAERGMDIGITWHTDTDGAQGTAEEVRSHWQKAYVAQRTPPTRRMRGVTIGWPRISAGWTCS